MVRLWIFIFLITPNYTDWMWDVRKQRGVKDNSKVFGLTSTKWKYGVAIN